MNEIVFRTLFWILLASLWVMRVYLLRGARQTGNRPVLYQKAIEQEGRGLFYGRTIVLLFLAVILVLYALDSPWLRTLSIPLPGWLRWTGFGIGLAGLGLWTWTQAELGKQYSPLLQVGEQHRLVTSGPYARIRHPMYTAMFCMGIAFALITANWGFVLFAAAMIAGFVVRAPREEQMMLAAFGKKYKNYLESTGRFFPKNK